MKLGNETLLAKHRSLLAGKKLGILAHAASRDSEGRHIIDLLVAGEKDGNWKVAGLFAPEHGLDSTAQDMEPVRHTNHKQKIPVHSLYGDSFVSLSPTPEMLKGIDTLIIDLQDIGARYYTYANTMALASRTCASLGLDVIVCDRPNPINGITTEGPTVDPEFRSFVGMFPLPVRHAMTIGELARFYQKNDLLDEVASKKQKIKHDFLTVIPMSGWNREWFFDETGLKWINPSPNIRSLAAALLYPGMCLLEGTNVSEGRGTHTPFEVCGAPWIEGEELARKMRSLKLAGIDFEATVFTPVARKFEGERCEGVEFTITDRHEFKPYLTGLALIHTLATSYRKDFKWRREPYEFVSDIPAIDLLTGNGKFRKFVGKNLSFEETLKKIF